MGEVSPEKTPEKDPTQKRQMKIQEKTKYENAGPEELKTEEVGRRN